jgi:hypothetical protein
MVGIALALAVAVGATVGVGEGEVHKVKSVVQEAPATGQQYWLTPQATIVPTDERVEQLMLRGVPSAFDGLQLRSKFGCPVTGQASAVGQRFAAAFS